MKQTDVRLRLYKTVLIAGISLSIISVIGNFIAGFEIGINVKWVFLLTICSIALRYSGDEKYSPPMMFTVFMALIYIFLPIGFINSGGSNNNAIGYALAFLITITFIFVGIKRIFLVGSLTTVFLGLQIFEYLHPEQIAVHTRQTQFIDHMIQVPLLIIVCCIVLNVFAKEYEKMNAKLLLYANHDELTGLYNRRAFKRAMEDLKDTSSGNSHLLLLDLDNFKKINDKHGHYIGDEILQKLSDFLKSHFDLQYHMVSRWGGDEFAIIYHGDRSHMIEKLDIIQKEFKAYVSQYEEAAGISMSIVALTDYQNGTEGLIAADHLLYEVKALKGEVNESYEK